MNQKVLSGAAKRKKKFQQTQHILKTNTKIQNYFKDKLFQPNYIIIITN